MWENGMSDSDWELCARTVGTPFVPQLVKKYGDESNAYFYTNSVSGQVPALITAVPLPAGSGNFPWGFNVQAD